MIEYIVVNKVKKQELDQMVEDLRDTLILLPSHELARARGGSHCMTLPLQRERF
jgi:arginine deiminase